MMVTKVSHSPRSLTTTLAITFFLLSVVVILISGSLLVLAYFQSQRTAIANDLHVTSQDAAKQVNGFFQDKFGALDTLATFLNPVPWYEAQNASDIDSMLGLQPAFRQLVILNSDGQVVAKRSRLSLEASYKFVEHLTPDLLRQIQSGKSEFTSVYLDSETNEPLVTMAVPIKDVFGQTTGTLAAEVNLKFMWDVVDTLHVGQTGVAYVVDRQGNLLAYKDTGRVLRGENVANLYHVREFVGGPQTVLPDWLDATPGIQGVSVIGEDFPLDSPDWAVITEIPTTESYLNVVATILTSGIIVLVVAFFAGLIGLYLARRLAVPLIALTDNAKRITEGELGVVTKVSGPSEVEELAAAFNTMTQRLQQTLAGLEQRVAERTRDLEANRNELAQRGRELEQANTQLQADSSYLAALNETTVGLMSRLDTNELLSAIVSRAGELVNTESGYIYLHEPGAPYMELRVGTGLYEQLVGAHVQAGAGLAGTVWQTGELLAINDYQHWEGRLPGALRQTIQAAVGIPLKSAQGVIGVIGLAYEEADRAFGETEVRVLDRFAQLALIALENARLFEQTQTAFAETERQARALARLNRGSSELASAKTFAEVVQIAQQTVNEVLTANRVSFALASADDVNMQIYGVQGEVGATPAGTELPLAGTTIAEALKTKRVVYSGDIAQDYNTPGMMRMIEQGLHSFINAPMFAGDHAFGTLNVSSKTVNKFSAQDINLVVQVASLTATALENLRLLEQTQNALHEAELLYRFTRDLSNATELEGLLRVAAEFGETFGMSSASLAFSEGGYLGSPSNGFDLYLGLLRDKQFKFMPPMHLEQDWEVPESEMRNVDGQPILLVANLAHSKIAEPGHMLARAYAFGMRSYCGLALVAENKWIGFLGFANERVTATLPDEALRRIINFANQFRTALQNWHLNKMTQAALAEAQRLAGREREAAEQVIALNRRLTGEGWQQFLGYQREGLRVEDGQVDTNGNAGEIPELERAAKTGELVISKTNGHSTVAVPIMVRGEVIGTIGLEDYDPQREWSSDRIGIVNDVVQNLGLALDNARLYTQSQRRVSELDALNRISQAVTTELNLDQLLNVIGDQVRQIFDVQNVYIALYDAQTQMISLPYFINDNKPAVVEPIRFGEGLTSHIIRTRQPLVLNNTSDRKMAEMGAKVYGNPAQSFLGVPIFVGDSVTGVISIQSTSREDAFDESNVRVLETVAATVGAAIQNAQLYGAMQQEVLVRQRAEEEIKLSLKEKEVLLKEIHHRVKNNLQIITSLLNLQSAQIKDPEAFTMFRESQARVRSMALIHEKLYQSKDLARIDFDGYVRDLMVYLFRSYAANPDQIQTEMDTSNMFLGIDTAIPCGLIISELVTNTMKYAFPGGRRGHLYIGLHPQNDGMLKLQVSDDGVGFKEGFDWRESDSLGLQLVSTLTSQLHGTIQVSGTNGACFILTFPG